MSIPCDAAFVLSGLVDSTQVEGSAYTGIACSSSYAHAWLEFAKQLSFAHEIAHLVNA